MKLHEALQSAGCASKHVDGEISGTYTVSKANISAGYYEDFKNDDRYRQPACSTSVYYGYDYPGADPLASIVRFAGEDGWTPRK